MYPSVRAADARMLTGTLALCLHVLSYSVDASEIADLHVISYEVERDLTPLILSNCQYRVERGAERVQEFHLERVQRQLASRFLQGKPRLSLRGIPTLVYRRDRNYEDLFADIRNKVPQVSAGGLICGTSVLSPFASAHAQARPLPGAHLSFGGLPGSLSPPLVPEGERAAVSARVLVVRERTEILLGLGLRPRVPGPEAQRAGGFPVFYVRRWMLCARVRVRVSSCISSQRCFKNSASSHLFLSRIWNSADT